MDNYLEQNCKDAIESFTPKQGTGKETGTPYYYIELKMNNGFSKRLFLNDGERFALQNAFDNM